MGLSFGMFPHTLHEFKIAIGGGLAVLYQLDFYQRWIVHVFLVAGSGFGYELFSEVVGKADSGWVDRLFEGADE
jgi:hypothetical protein